MTLTRFTGCARRSVAFVCSLLLVAVSLPHSPASEVRAFNVYNSLLKLADPESWTHEMITNAAFHQLARELDTRPIPGLFDTASMRRALAEITTANVNVDEDQSRAELHFDGESFPEGQQRLRVLRTSAVAALRRNDYRAARRALGAALHSIQDFYSHSNYIELNVWRCGLTLICNIPPHPALGRDLPLDRLPAETPTCEGCQEGCGLFCFPVFQLNALTSGYYSGENRVSSPGKCSHGGPSDKTGLPGINKDSIKCEVSEHSRFHFLAAEVAVKASAQFMHDILAAAGPEKFKVVLGISEAPAIGFVVEVSDWMLPYIEGVKLTIRDNFQLIGERLLVVAAARDDANLPALALRGPVDLFTLPIYLSLLSGGSNDFLHPLYTAMKKALNSMQGGQLTVFVASGPNDSALAPEVEALARGKNVSLNFIFFETPALTVIHRGTFYSLASHTGGQVYSVSSSELNVLPHLVDSITRPEQVDLLRASGSAGGGQRVYTVSIDSSITSVTFSSVGANFLHVRRPDGLPLPPFFPGVSYTRLHSGGDVYTVSNPPPGEWTLTLLEASDFSLKVTADSPVDLSSGFLRPGGQGPHEALFPATGLPVVGKESAVSVSVSGDLHSPQFALRDENGALLQTLDLSASTETASDFTGRFVTPATPFRIYVTGQDANEYNVQRSLSAPIQPQTVKIEAPVAQDLQRGRVSNYTFKVTNSGPAGDFNVSAADDMGYVTNTSPTSFSLGTNQSRDVTVRLQPPADTEVGTANSLTVSVAGTSDTANNFTTVDSLVVLPNDPPDLTRARPSLARLWPPNHMMTDVSILGVTDPDGDAITIQIDGITSDETTNGQGDGDTCPDASGIGMSTARLRAERDGNDNGRVYTVAFIASDARGASSRGSVKICVPQNNRAGCQDKERAYNATSCDSAPFLRKPKLN